MLTSLKIFELMKDINKKHTKPLYGVYPPQKKIMDYVLRKIGQIQRNKKFSTLEKVQEMTNLLEGFIRYLNDTNKILKLDIEKVLTYIYYPENEIYTMDNKDNLLIGNKGETVRSWHDAYFINNRGSIINRLIDCKNVLYDTIGAGEYMDTSGDGMPEQMQRKYQEMLSVTDSSMPMKRQP